MSRKLTEAQERLLLQMKMGGRIYQGSMMLTMPSGATSRPNRNTVCKLLRNDLLFTEPSCTYYIYAFDGWKDAHKQSLSQRSIF